MTRAIALLASTLQTIEKQYEASVTVSLNEDSLTIGLYGKQGDGIRPAIRFDFLPSDLAITDDKTILAIIEHEWTKAKEEAERQNGHKDK